MYNEYKQLNLPEIDREILEFWDANDIFKKSVEQRDADNSFVFYEGPPSANGMPGIHHVMARAMKDIFCRYQTLKGKRVERKGGWDTHGLPIELQVEKELGIKKEDIGIKVSVDDYNKACKATVMRYKDRWDDMTRKMGHWLDLDNPYITFENDYIESCWYLLKKMYDKGLLYKGYTIQPFSPAAGTGLSSHELNMPGAYREVTDVSAVAMFKVIEDEKSAFLFSPPLEGSGEVEDVRIIAWTTTPWTLPSNVALTVGPNVTYVKVKCKSPYLEDKQVSVILAEALVSKWFGGKNQPAIIESKVIGTGADLAGIRYEQLFPYGNEIEQIIGSEGRDSFKVIVGDFVTTEDGTGIVHTAPSFGADDMKAGRANGMGTLTLVDKRGRFLDTVGEFSGEFVKGEYLSDDEKAAEVERMKNAEGDDEYTALIRNIVTRTNAYLDVNERIILRLQLDNKLFKKEKYVHNYPHCWRTDKPILYYPLDSWFIRASSMKERMSELNKTINWKPAATGEGRFGKWLENLNDWNLSRSRYWGTPLPIWRTEDGSEEIIIGTAAQLAEEIEKANKALNLNQVVPADFHRPYIDEVVLVSPNGKKMIRETDLIDVWFDSGAMPFAQWHYPMENQEKWKSAYPADYISEGVDQTRGWFYTLHAISVMVEDSVAFKNVVSTGLVLDKNGQKMSKRLGNAIDPFETIGKHGADVTRWYMTSNSQPWDNLKFDLEGLTEVRNKFFGTLYNTYNFFAMYANVDGFKYKENNIALENRPEIDRWILSRLNSLIKEVNAQYADYEPTNAARLLEKFVDSDLSNWYVRLCRRRFWKGDYSEDKISAYQTLYTCMEAVAKMMSPIAPFFGDWLYRNLNNVTQQDPYESVHLSFFPKVSHDAIDLALEQRMDYAQRISSLILSLRKGQNIRVRQPLSRVLLPVVDEGFITQIEGVKDLILAETNIKTLEFITDTSNVVKKRAKANFKAKDEAGQTLGARLGKDMKAVAAAIEGLSNEDIITIEKSNSYALTVGENTYHLAASDFEIISEDIPGWLVANDGALIVALDVKLTEDLIIEGYARELISKLQNNRKEKNYDITEKIQVNVEASTENIKALEKLKDYIASEILATDIVVADESQAGETIGSEREIRALITQLESERIERTISTKDMKKFSQAICAFANDFSGSNEKGYLIIGVNDNGTLSGLKVTDELLKDVASIKHNAQILPKPTMTVQKYTFDEGDIVLVEVEPSLHPPVRYDGRVWIRTGASKSIATEQDERRLIEKRTSNVKTFDALPLIGASINDLDINLFKNKYLPYAIDSDTLNSNGREIKQQLASLRMYDLRNDCPTNVGIITLSQDPIYFLPGAYIQYVKFEGSSTSNILIEKRFTGNLIDLIENLVNFVQLNIIKEKPIRTDGFAEIKVINYPMWALRELLMNAIMHRDYESNSPIRVYEFDDRIQIQNPGGLYGDATSYNFPRIGAYRNPVIAEVLKNLGYINRFNVGINNAREKLNENGNPEPFFDLTLQTAFLVNVYSKI